MICLKCGKEYEGNFSITGNNLCSVCDAVMVHMDGPMREVEKRYTPSAISVIRELETNIAAAQATIEKQRKVIEWMAIHGHRLCIRCAYREADCGGAAGSPCIAGIIAYAEKQVEEGK